MNHRTFRFEKKRTWRRKGCCKSSKAVALWAGSRTSILSMKPRRRGETLWAFFNLGGGMSRMRRIAWEEKVTMRRDYERLSQGSQIREHNSSTKADLLIIRRWQTHLQRRFVEKWRFSVHHLYAHDSKRPYVNLGTIGQPGKGRQFVRRIIPFSGQKSTNAPHHRTKGPWYTVMYSRVFETQEQKKKNMKLLVTKASFTDLEITSGAIQ